MTFDKQEHKDAVLSLLQQATVPVKMLGQIQELLSAVETATIVSEGAILPPAGKSQRTRQR